MKVVLLYFVVRVVSGDRFVRVLDDCGLFVVGTYGDQVKEFVM